MASQQRDLNWRSFLGLNEPADAPALRQVIKRDGSLESYNRWKIAAAISKAITAAYGEEDKRLVEKLTDLAEKKLVDLIHHGDRSL